MNKELFEGKETEKQTFLFLQRIAALFPGPARSKYILGHVQSRSTPSAAQWLGVKSKDVVTKGGDEMWDSGACGVTWRAGSGRRSVLTKLPKLEFQF